MSESTSKSKQAKKSKTEKVEETKVVTVLIVCRECGGRFDLRPDDPLVCPACGEQLAEATGA